MGKTGTCKAKHTHKEATDALSKAQFEEVTHFPPLAQNMQQAGMSKVTMREQTGSVHEEPVVKDGSPTIKLPIQLHGASLCAEMSSSSCIL